MNNGYVIIHCECVACRIPIAVNPNYCPSLRINGERKPLCPACHAKWNQIHRISKGLAPIPLHPEAYAPLPESELHS